MTNAIDAISGPGTIHIVAGAESDHYCISVTDTGSGIAPGLRERILEPFFTTRPVGDGMGLGLSITDSIVRKHDGSLEFCDADGGGTMVTIRLPWNGSV
jgi:two-component system NtrC family sensor kinase